MPDEVTLELEGQRLGGWTSVVVTRSIEAFAGSFRFESSEKSPDDPLGRPLRLGDRAVVRIGETRLLTGWVDQLAPSYGPESHTIGAAGRSLTADLVDCSATHEPGEWRGRKLEQIAHDLAKPFGVKVRAEVDTGAAFEVFKLEPSETVYAAIERAARHRGVLPVTNGEGDLVLTRVGKTRVGVELRKGELILAGRASLSDRDRFESYRVIGQRRSIDAASDEAPQTAVEGRATDPAIQRFRPLVILAEEPGDAGSYRDRARWEASYRAGKAVRATLTVQGWSHPGGIWLPNRRVRVVDEWLGIRREMLIAGVTWLLDGGGRRTELSVAPPEAFDPEPLPEAKGTRAGEIWT